MVKINQFGFYELTEKPSPEALADFYSSQYFDSRNFELAYGEEEFFHKQIGFMEAHRMVGLSTGRMLDIGCGEGFGLFYFQRAGWEVVGTDYSVQGVSRHFPDLAARVKVSDTERLIDEFITASETFDLVILNNVLEHVLDPLRLLERVRCMLSPRGLARIQVPNDFSYLQQHALERGYIDKQFWIYPREHMSYFNPNALRIVLGHCGFGRTEFLGDFPIDFNLFNPDSNYIRDPSRGPNCHRERIAIENMMARQGIDNLIAFRRGCGQSGIGRNVIAYAGR